MGAPKRLMEEYRGGYEAFETLKQGEFVFMVTILRI